jgi:Lrp/AsnC family transcriptional regulator for asnA, asnC and gidA
VKVDTNVKLDALDAAIIDLLRQNGRMSNREVGRALQISEGTVRQRLKKLIDSKSMRLGMVTDFEASGLAAGVILRISALPARARKIAEEIALLDACTFVALSLGPVEIIAVLVNKSRIEAAELIDKRIRSIQGIQAIEVQEPVSYAKHRYDLVYAT